MFSVRSVCLSVCLSVCPSDYSETCKRMLTKFFGGVGHGSRTKWYNFGGDPDHASDPGVQSPKSGSSGSAEGALWVLFLFLVCTQYTIFGPGNGMLETLRKQQNCAFLVWYYVSSVLIMFFTLTVKLQKCWFPPPDGLWTLTPNPIYPTKLNPKTWS